MQRQRFFKEQEVKQYIADTIGEYEIDEDLHHNMFNMDHYIIGTDTAKKWMGDNAFDCIETVQSYEDENFGERGTDCSDPEKVVNMFVYIVGEYLLSEMGEEELLKLQAS